MLLASILVKYCVSEIGHFVWETFFLLAGGWVLPVGGYCMVSASAECRSTAQPGYTSLVKSPVNWDLHNASCMGRDPVLLVLHSTCTIFDIIFIRYLNDHALYHTVFGVACTARYKNTVQAIRY
jgi:hypothetical protein